MDTDKLKKIIITALPLVLFFWIGDKLCLAYRTVTVVGDISVKLMPFLDNLGTTLVNPLPSFHPLDVFVGVATAVIARLVLIYKDKHRKKFAQDEEYGSARWGNAKDIEPYMDKKDFADNVLLTQSERLTMGKPSNVKYARNQNVLVVGGSGSGKTRFYVKPNLMQMHSSYVVTDPKGTTLPECGKMLQRGQPIVRNGEIIGYKPYSIRVFNTIDFDKSMHYNPFAYIRPKTREQDILRTVEVLIANTTGEQKGGDEFWVKAEKLLYTSYIALILTMCPENEWNFETLIDFVNASECREDDESFKNAIDWAFYYLEKWIEKDWEKDEKFAEQNANYSDLIDIEVEPWRASLGRFAVRQYKAYKLAAGKTAKSILISCATRLAPFSIDRILEITSYDEMHLDTVGDELTALFIIVSDTDDTFNFLVAMMYTQLFNLLCTKADNNPDGSGRLKYPVRCLIDEFANIKQIPQFEKIISVIRSRGISASIILQTKSQLKSLYKDNAETIEGNCDSLLFLGGKEKTTLKDISESLGKETIYMFNTSRSRGTQESYGVNYQKLGKELKSQDELAVMDNSLCILQIRGLHPFLSKKFDITKHKNYKMLFDYAKQNYFDVAKFVAHRNNRSALINKNSVYTEYKYNK
ncbi:MAG TPA: type IV secretory system conjugative DNA transfer family protein [Ruminococcus bromii]|jgi:type IV secretion system protein VirD4|nr:type IV secretory system conjugative DNA transfer family protein [Ruminococcus bromii]HJI63685.1 type IV secretory system conjugative DNA transfer family protein [Ruminococcus bromii]